MLNFYAKARTPYELGTSKKVLDVLRLRLGHQSEVLDVCIETIGIKN